MTQINRKQNWTILTNFDNKLIITTLQKSVGRYLQGKYSSFRHNTSCMSNPRFIWQSALNWLFWDKEMTSLQRIMMHFLET